MLKQLVKARISSVLYTMNFADKNGKKRKTPMKNLVILLGVYIGVMLVIMSTLIFLPLCEPFCLSGFSWFYFAFAGIMSFVICFIGSIFSTQAQLFEAKDNELLLSMPIKPSDILMSRMVFLVLMNYVYEAFIMIPAFAVYWVTVPDQVGVMNVVTFVMCFLTLPMLALSFSSLFGWILSLITSKIRRKDLFVTISSFIFLGLYFSVYFKIEGYMESLINNGSEVANAIRETLSPAYYLGRAISYASVSDTALFMLFCIVPFAVVCFVISMFFSRIVSSSGELKRNRLKPLAFKKRSQGVALLYKETAKFLSSPQYIMNAGLGGVFAVAFGIIVLINGESVTTALSAVFSGIADSAPELLCTSLCLIISFCFVSCPSISLEAKTLWLIKSIPVSARDILLSKVLMHITVVAPLSLCASILCIISIPMTVGQSVIILLAPLSVLVFEAFFGVVINLLFPKFDWTSETVVIKQSAASLITMFGTLGAVGIPALFYTEILAKYVSVTVYFTVFISCFVLASVLLYRYICTKGAARFKQL